MLKVNQDVKGAVKLRRNVVAVMIALVVAARLALRASVITLTHHLRVDTATLLNAGCESLNAREAV